MLQSIQSLNAAVLDLAREIRAMKLANGSARGTPSPGTARRGRRVP